MLTCYRCGRAIMGKAISTNPPLIAIQLGADFPKSFHPMCYGAEKAQAKRELHASAKAKP